MSSPSQGQLSKSTIAALKWATAASRFRLEQEGGNPVSAVLSVHDLLVGILLSHPKTSMPMELLKHLNATPGHILPKNYVRPSGPDLTRHLSTMTSTDIASYDNEVEMIMEEGTKLGFASGDSNYAELDAFFAVMLNSSNKVGIALGDILEGYGLRLDAIRQIAIDYLKGDSTESSFSQYLEVKAPIRPVSMTIPNYKADHVQSSGLVDDLVDIRAEVDAFAYLLASRGLKPPLAVGLFGDWGSGKSFFIDAVLKRIDELSTAPAVVEKSQVEVPFWKRIVQIKFNAWHYVEGDLWASLVEHIFSQLRLVSDRDDKSLVEKRRDHWIQKLDSKRGKLSLLQDKRRKTEKDLKQKQQQAESLRQRRDAELLRLEEMKSKVVTESILVDSLKDVEMALKPVFSTLSLPTPEEALQKLDHTREELLRTRSLFGALIGNPFHAAILVVSLILVPVIIWYLNKYSVPNVLTALSALTTALAPGMILLNRAASFIKQQVSKVSAAEKKVREEIDQKISARNEEINATQEAIDNAETRLSGLLDEESTISGELDGIKDELEKVTSAKVLSEFVADRVGSGDYRKRLGIPALIQEDFRCLSELIKGQNSDLLDKEKRGNADDQNHFNRIILYIDDLDRCPEDRVIEVLQAVHLLLAFDLFVVMVAVDSRWLNHALTKHYPALTSESNHKEHANSDDYLEKIFQVPFWVEPLGDDAKRNIVNGLLNTHLQPGKQDVGQPVDDPDRPDVGEKEIQVLSSMKYSEDILRLETTALSIRPEELQFMDDLAPLYGETPRAVKRFVNLYQLLRIIRKARDLADDQVNPPDYEISAFVLAIGDGLPKLGPELIQALMEKSTQGDWTLENALDSIPVTHLSVERSRLVQWLDLYPHWKNLSADRLLSHFRLSERFLFRVGGRWLTRGS